MSTTDAAGPTGLSDRWQRWFRALPLVLLAGGGILGLLTQDFVGDRLGGRPSLVALLVVTAAWTWAWDLGPLRRRTARRERAAYWLVRSLLALVLTLVNPFLGFFAFIGYIDAPEIFRGRALVAALVLTAATVAGTQAGGLPVATGWQWALYAVLVAVNSAIAGTFQHFSTEVERVNKQRGETIAELERVNRELSEALRRNEALATTVAAQEREAGVRDERQRLAREIHDTIAQGLAGVVSQLRAAREVADPGEARAHVDRAEALARDSLVEARRSMHDLAPGALAEQDLPTALDRLVAAWDRAHDPAAELTLTGPVGPLHPEVEATVLRVVQEALANVARHARATRVGVTLTWTDADLLVDVRDDGAGFDPDAVAPSASFGLRGMRQRAEGVAGRLAVEAAPGRGTALSLQLPALRPAPDTATEEVAR